MFNSNDKYIIVKDTQKLQRMLNSTMSDKPVAITEEVNLTVQKTLSEQFRTLFSHKAEAKSKDKYS